MMEAKEYLEQARYLDMRINAKLAVRAKFKVQSSKFKDEGISPALEDLLCGGGRKWAELEAEIDREIDELAELKLKITQLIRRVSKPEYRTVLELRYLCFWSWEKIALNMGYSPAHIYRIHTEALEAFSEILNGKEK